MATGPRVHPHGSLRARDSSRFGFAGSNFFWQFEATAGIVIEF
jgi:hypothetical protein